MQAAEERVIQVPRSSLWNAAKSRAVAETKTRKTFPTAIFYRKSFHPEQQISPQQFPPSPRLWLLQQRTMRIHAS